MNAKKLLLGLTFLITLIFQMGMPHAAHAAGTVGSGTPESCTEAALDLALTGGGAVNFDCGGPATIVFTGTKTISASTQINGAGLITLSGGDAVRLFSVNSPATLTLSNLTISNGFVSGGHGGAILINSGAMVTISNSTLSNNKTVGGYGGAIYVGAGTLNVTNSTFSANDANVQSIGNVALGGGAIQNNDGTVTISRSTFKGNSVTSHTADGGAIYNGDFDAGFVDENTGIPDALPDVLYVSNSTFYDNRLLNTSGIPSSGNAGGAIRSSSSLTVAHSTFSDNDSGVNNPNAEAGAVTVTHGTATLTNNIFANSTAADCAIRVTIAGLNSSGNLIETNNTQFGGCGTPVVSADPLLGPLQDNGGPTETMALLTGSPAINALGSCSLATDQRGVSRPQPSGGSCDIGAFEVDATAPAVTNVSSTTANGVYGVGNSIQVTVTFSEPVYVTGMPQLTLETGTTDQVASYFSGSGTTSLTFTYAVQAGDTSTDLDYTSTTALSLNSGAIQDLALNAADLTLPAPGGAGSLAANKAIVIDTSSPYLFSFVRQTPSASLTNADALVFRASFSGSVTGVDTADFTVDGTTTATVTNVSAVNASTYDITVSGGNLAGFNGVVGLNLSDDQNITDPNGIDLPTGEPGIDETYTLDNTLPSVSTITRVNSSPTTASSVDFSVTFTENVTGVDATDFALTKTGSLSGTSITAVTGSDDEYTVTVNTGSGSGTLRLDLVFNGTVHDAAGNDLDDAHVGDELYSIDRTVPSVVSIVRTDPNTTNAPTVRFTVTFSESVTGVNAADFALTTTGVNGASIASVSGFGSTYTVTVNTGTRHGTIRLDVVDDDTIKDGVGYPLGGVGTGNGNFTGGQVYNILKSYGPDTTGVFRPSNGALYLKNSNTSGFADIQINYGQGGDYPVVGDWDGNGTATIGIYRNGQFYLRQTNSIGFADLVFPFGAPGDQPIAGDWDGDGDDTIGVYRSSTGTFFLRNSNTAGAPEMIFSLGIPGDVGIAGDWDGDGVDTTGVFRPTNGALYLKNTNATGFADIQINYGQAGDKPVTGDWDGDGDDTIGVYRNGQFMLRNSNTIGFAEIVFGLGVAGDHPIAGNWDGKP